MVKDALLPKNAALKKAVRSILRKSGTAPQPHLLTRLTEHYGTSDEGPDRRVIRAVLMQALAVPPPEPVEFKPAQLPEPEPIVEPDPIPEPEPEPEPAPVSTKPKKEEKMMSLDLSNAAAMLQFDGDDEDDDGPEVAFDESGDDAGPDMDFASDDDTAGGAAEFVEDTPMRSPNIDFAVEDTAPNQDAAFAEDTDSDAPAADVDPTDALVAQEVAAALTDAPEPEFNSAEDPETAFKAMSVGTEAVEDTSEAEAEVPIDDAPAEIEQTDDSAEEEDPADTDDSATEEEVAPPVEAKDTSEKEATRLSKDSPVLAPKKGVPHTDLAALGGDSSLFDQLGDSFGDMDD